MFGQYNSNLGKFGGIIYDPQSSNHYHSILAMFDDKIRPAIQLSIDWRLQYSCFHSMLVVQWYFQLRMYIQFRRRHHIGKIEYFKLQTKHVMEVSW